MGDFESTFGSGSDAVDIIDRYNQFDNDDQFDDVELKISVVLSNKHRSVELIGNYALAYQYAYREDFYDDQTGLIESHEFDEFYGRDGFGSPFTGEVFYVVKSDTGNEFGYVRIWDGEILHLVMRHAGNGAYWSATMLEPLLRRHGCSIETIRSTRSLDHLTCG